MKETGIEIEMGRMIFEAHLRLLKQLLRLGEYKFGRNSAEYRYYREEVMRFCHEAIERVYDTLERKGIIEACSCGADRKGWTNCPDCGGSGYKEKEPVTRISDTE